LTARDRGRYVLFYCTDGAGILPVLLLSHSRRLIVLAKTSRKKKKVSVKEMKFRHDPMIRFYEKSQEWLQEKGRPFLIAVAIIAGIVFVYAVGSYFFDYRKAKAENAFADAVEKFNAPVQDASTPTTTPSAGKTYLDEQTKWQESAEAFDRLASDYSGRYGTIGRYYAGVCYLHIDRDKAISLLEQVAGKKDQPTSDLARLALAENYAAIDDNDKAISLYEELLKSSTNLKPAVEVGLGRVYEKIGDKEKAIEAYLEAARPDRSTEAGSEAEKRLQAIAPDRLKDLPPQTNVPIQP
jgi:tetratricopeptide (TPR) repeat protein